MVIRMEGIEYALDADARAFLDQATWDSLAFNERTIRDTGLPFSDDNVAWAKRWAYRTAVYRTLVRAGLILESDPHTGLLTAGGSDR